MKNPSTLTCRGALVVLPLALLTSASLAQTANILSPTGFDPPPDTPLATLPPVTVVASRTAQPLADVLGDVTVIPRERLDAAAGQSVAQVLRQVAGIEITDNGGPQTVTRLFLRGSNSNQTLVLIDGIRINAATNGGAALNALNLADFERIEILRGAASSLYGADAVGGVINLVTRQAEGAGPLRIGSQFGIGSDRTLQGQVSLRGSSADWRYSLQTGYAQSRGFDATRPDFFLHNPDRDSYYQQNTTASLGHTWATGQDLDFRLFYSRINGGYDAGLPWFNDRSIQSLQGYQLSSRNVLHERWTSTLRASYQRDRLENRNAPASLNPDNPPDGISRFGSRQIQLSWQNDLSLGQDQMLTLGIESLSQRVSGDLADYSQWPAPPRYVDYAETRRNTRSALAIYRGQWRIHHLQASVRHDHDSQYGGQTTGGLAYGLDVTERLRLSLAGSTAFRAPDFNELYYPGAGNPALQPERARNLEAGLQYRSPLGDFGITAYRNRVKDLIAGFPSENIQRAVLEGVTLTSAHRWGSTQWQTSLDLQNPHDAQTGELLPLRAKRILRVAAQHQIGAWQLGFDTYASSARYDRSANVRLPGYALLDLSLAYQLTASQRVQLRWNNVFDRDYSVVAGYATPGSQVFLTWTYQLD